MLPVMDDNACGFLGAANPYSASSYAVQTDIQQASAAVEMARHAQSVGTVATLLRQAATWLDWAASDYATVFRNAAAAQRVQCLAGQVRALADTPASWGDLSTFQSTQLYSVQSSLRALNDDATSLAGHDWSVAFWSVVGIVSIIWVVAAVDEAKAQRA